MARPPRRQKVLDAALAHWYAARQDEAMIEQFAEPSTENQAEQQAWKRIRRSAATRRL